MRQHSSHLDALHQQCISLFQQGQTESAIAQLLLVWNANPKNWRFGLSLVEMYRTSDQSPQALAVANTLCKRANYASCFGARGLVHLSLNLLHEAEADFNKALTLDPTHSDSLGNLFTCLRLQGKFEVGKALEKSYATLVNSRPELMNNLGSLYFADSEYPQALERFKKAAVMQVGYLMPRINIVKTHLALEQLENALSYLNSNVNVHEIDDKFLEAVLQRCESLERPDQFARLVSRISSELDTDRITRLLVANRGPLWHLKATKFYAMSGQDQEAMKIFDCMLRAAPDNVVVLNNNGSFLFATHQVQQAKECFEKILKIDPINFMVWRNIGVCHAILGDRAKALEYYCKAYELNKKDQPSLVLMLDAKLHLAKWENFYEDCSALEKLMQDPGEDLIGSLQLLPLTESATVQRHYLTKASRLFFAGLPQIDLKPKTRCVQHSGPIRLGYLSFDIRDHPVSYLTAEVFELHDRSKFEVHIFSYGPDQDKSGLRQRISKSADHFYDLKDKSLVEMARIIHDANIDVLVDLTANTQHTRSEILAYRLAPIQMHWLGFMATMGSECYDYILTDPITSPLGYDSYFQEKLIRLPHTLQPNDRKRILPSRKGSREEMGLPANGTVFCNFAQSFKIQPKIFNSWMRILDQVPDSVFWMSITDMPTQDRLRRYATAKGIDGSRLIFAPRVSLEDHLVRYTVADLLLDTYPIGSGTTASECLWMGCPILVYAGELMYSRMAGGILHAAEMDSFICDSLGQYESRAIELGNDKVKLEHAKFHLTEHREKLPLFNSPLFVSNFEKALQLAVNQSRETGTLEAISV